MGRSGFRKKDCPTYNSWHDMKKRCRNKRAYCYHRYGGRGIKVCERWLNSYANFLADMGEKPDGLTLDRIDNDGDYEPSNCRWTTRLEQILNSSITKPVTFLNRTMSRKAWAKELGISYSTLIVGIKKLGIEAAFEKYAARKQQ